MNIKKYTANEERMILTGMILNKFILGKITSKWKKGMFKSSWANIVGDWCVDYFNKFDKPPRKHIQGLFESWAQETQDEDGVSLIEKFLSNLSEDYKRMSKDINPDYVLDIAGKYFAKVAISKLNSALQGDLDMGKYKQAEKRIANFLPVELGGGEGVDVLRDDAAIRRALEEESKPLFSYPGAFGRFINNQLCRESFICFMGPEKRGKSFWLGDMAWQGMKARRKVAFFSVGDMTEPQMMRRFLVRACRRPRKAKKIKIPISIAISNKASHVEYKEYNYDTPLSFQYARKACDYIISKTKSKDELLRLSTHPMNTLTVKGIESILDGWARDGWAPDIIVIDYADILDMGEGEDMRANTNKTWMALRALSQKLHCLVITATQANAASYDADTLSKSNFTEDKRKLAHVTAMVGINQTKEEKRKGIQRLNYIVLRDDEYHESNCVYVAGCLAIAAPVIRSCFQFKGGSSGNNNKQNKSKQNKDGDSDGNKTKVSAFERGKMFRKRRR